MSHPVIQVSHLSKNFRFYSDRPTSIKTLLVDALRGKVNFGKRQEFSALRDINFDIRAGEFVGIMGRNGAGKSTLLKIISGVYAPTEGQIQTNGTIAPLIELGAGFHGDLSGYENIFLNSAILGYGRNATKQSLQAILEFAELGDKIYMPIKNYSSGMLVRLAFSIATHLPAPILLVDEILAVGDAGFQVKCLNKVRALHEEGRTIVLITHDPDAVEKYCTRCIVIEEQMKRYDGPVGEGVRIYRSLFSNLPAEGN